MTTLRHFMQALLFISLFGGIALCLIAVWVRRVVGNNDDRPRVRTVITSENNREVIGDGAWSATPAVFPSERLRRLREIEPRGV